MDLSKNLERGAANVLIIIIVLVLVIGGYAGFQLFPLYWDHWNFEDTVRTVITAPTGKDVEAGVKQQIMQLLDRMGAQYQPEHVRVDVNTEQKSIEVEVWYTRPHHLPLYPNPKQFYLKLRQASILPKINLPQRTPLPETAIFKIES